MDDNGLWFLPGLYQTVQILVVMEDISSNPIDEPDIGVARAASIVVKLGIRVEQEVGNPSNRDNIFNRIGTAV